MRFKRFICLLTAAFMVFAMPVLALADTEKDTAGNMTVAGGTEIIKDDTFFGGFGAGREVSVENSSSKDSICLAGMNVSVIGSKAGGSVFLAGKDVEITDSDISGNIAAAGEKVVIDNASARGVKISAYRVVFDGEALALNAAGDTVEINGVIDGDASVVADRVIIGDNARITGTLSVESDSEAEISDSAEIGKYVFDKTEKISENTQPSGDFRFCIYSIACMIVLTLVMCWLTPSFLDRSGEMARRKTAVMLGSGAVVLVSLPFAFILLCITVIGIPLAVLSALAVSALLIAAVPFTGASLAREFIPQWNKLAASLAGAAALVILVHIPYIGIIVRAGSWIYILGYCLQRMWQGRSRREIKASADSEETEAVNADYESVSEQ